MDRSGTAPGPGWDAGTAAADTTAAAARFPAWLPSPRSGDSGTPGQQLRTVIGALAGSNYVRVDLLDADEVR